MKLECEVIRDLLPLYVEELASKQSGKHIEEHVADCADCRRQLEEMQADKLPPVEVDEKAIKALSKRINRKKWFTVLTALFVALTLIAGFLVMCVVPVYLTYDEAIESVEVRGDRAVYVKRDPKSNRYTVNNDIYFTAYRCTWIVDMIRGDEPYSETGWVSTEWKDVWYIGLMAGEEDRLICKGQKDIPRDTFFFMNDVSYTTVYLFWTAVGCAVVMGLVGILLRRNKAGKILLSIGLFFLCLAAACLFVTGGRMIHHDFGIAAEYNGFRAFEYGTKYGGILVLALTSWASFVFGISLAKQYIAEKKT